MSILILITGAAGFIGQELSAALLQSHPSTHLILTDIVEPKLPAGSDPSHIKCFAADLTSPAVVRSSFSTKLSAAFLLHGIMSGGSEANLELGLKVNLDSFRTLLDFLRENHQGIKVVFPSSLAVYGPLGEGEVVSEKTAPMPQNSYGSQKLIVETLINDFSRRELLDGRVCRLPTIIVRPGAPTAAASSFASGIVREPLQGKESVLPVDESLPMWVCSPKTVVKNLVYALSIPKEKFGLYRTVNLPGITVKVGDILEALEMVGGKKARALVKREKDEKTEAIVLNWPAYFDVKKAKSLGFYDDQSLKETVEDFAKSL